MDGTAAMDFDFDEIIERRGTHADKWDGMEAYCGLSAPDALPMWVADMDFRPPAPVQRAIERIAAHGVYGYYGNDRPCREAVAWWMKTRHGWDLPAEGLFFTHGLVNGTALAIDAFTQPGDGVVLHTPVYHAFARVIRASGRRLVECPMTLADGRYGFDFDAMDRAMTGGERMFILCSPHNPGGRVWTVDELRGVADFCLRHDLILVSDEIHHDLTYPGHKHTMTALAAPGIADRLVTMTAPSKTFNIAAGHTGNVIIGNEVMRKRFDARMAALGLSPNAFGMHMVEAAYSPEGAVWVDALRRYLDGNRRLFDEGIAGIPGLKSMKLEATYLAWVDFAGAGMDAAEAQKRVVGQARIAVNAGPSFGRGGESCLRFNLATPRARVAEAVDRLKTAFADLQ
ncbi:MAG: MalY/PatB family protein [Paracoccaceae bacterium]